MTCEVCHGAGELLECSCPPEWLESRTWHRHPMNYIACPANCGALPARLLEQRQREVERLEGRIEVLRRELIYWQNINFVREADPDGTVRWQMFPSS